MTDAGGPSLAMDDRRETARPAIKRLLIVLMNTDPRNVTELGAPFYHAAVAAAMDYEVDVLCTAAAGELMQKGVAEKWRRSCSSSRAIPRRSMIGSRKRTSTARGFGRARPISSFTT